MAIYRPTNERAETYASCVAAELVNYNILTATLTHSRLKVMGLGVPGVGQYQKKHSPTHTRLDHQTHSINFLLYNDP